MLRDAAKRIVMAASRLLGAAAACVILLSFAAEDRKSYWNGCIKAAKVICQQFFLILARIIFFLKFLSKVLQNRLFVALASRSGFGAAISDALARSSIVFCNSVSADRIVVAASRLLGAAAACVILLSFATEDRKSYWNGCIKAVKMICQQIFFTFGANNFLFEIPFKKCFKIVFLSLWRRDPSGCGAAISDAIARSSIVFCNSVSVDRIVMAASRLLGAAAASVILLSFAAEDRKSYWNGCIKAAKVNCQQIFSILALIIFRLKFLLKSASKSSFCRFGVRFWSCNFRRHCT